MKNIILFSLLFCSSLLFAQITITEQPTVAAITTTSIQFSWTTDVVGTSELRWGYTEELEQTPVKTTSQVLEHRLSVTELNASELVYIQAYSVSGTDTAFADSELHITASGSNGKIKVYFNATVDTEQATAEDAIFVDNAIADTLVNYINRAQETVDIAIYNIDNSSDIITALNNAYARGVLVRVVYNGSTTNSGIDNLNSNIGKVESPTGIDEGIMHNKFAVIDLNASDPNDAVVWTGSTNFTSSQLNKDPNDVIVIYDRSLAKAYTIEFNEMFGSSGATPSASNAKFGAAKEDNTPHIFNIGGTRVESYFSPSDQTHAKIIETIEGASSTLDIATMLITREDIAKAIRTADTAGVESRIIMDDIDQYTQDQILVTALGSDFRTMGEAGIMHHKYMIADRNGSGDEAKVLTGSHNWSSSAKDRNDENTLIVHNSSIANLYYQEFAERFANGEIIAGHPICNADSAAFFDGDQIIEIDIVANDSIWGLYSVSISEDTEMGLVEINTDNTLSYRPKLGFDEGIDSVKYKVCSKEYGSMCDEAWVEVYVNPKDEEVSLYNNFADEVMVFPSTGVGVFTLMGNVSDLSISVINVSGQVVFEQKGVNLSAQAQQIDLSENAAGMYYLIGISANKEAFTKTIVIK